MKFARQGDIGFSFGEYTDTEGVYWDGSVPEDAEEKEDGVIAEGEISGHHHRLSDGAKAALLIAGAVAYVRALRETEVIHEEHNTIILPAEDCKITRQREYRPDGWAQVLD